MINSTAFSATITIGALVLPPTILGKTEASTTRMAAMPRTHKVGSTTAMIVAAHATAPNRMMHGGGRLAQIRLQLGIAARFAAGAHFGGLVGRKSRRIAELPGESQAAQQRRAVLWIRQDIRIHPRRETRIAAREPHLAAAARVQIHHAHREAMTQGQRKCMRVTARRLKRDLYIRAIRDARCCE